MLEGEAQAGKILCMSTSDDYSTTCIRALHNRHQYSANEHIYYALVIVLYIVDLRGLMFACRCTLMYVQSWWGVVVRCLCRTGQCVSVVICSM